MKVGTKSILFGVHQFLWHPLTVLVAWRKLYGKWPSWWELIAIFCHDLGYWRCSNMDGAEGRGHPYVGAEIAANIAAPIWEFFHPSAPIFRGESFWIRIQQFTLRHSRELSKRLNLEPSKLCWADKYCVCVEPRWLYLLRARLSGEILEYMDNAKPIEKDLSLMRELPELYACYGLSADKFWLDWYRNKVENLPEIKKLLAKPNCFVPTL